VKSGKKSSRCPAISDSAERNPAKQKVTGMVRKRIKNLRREEITKRPKLNEGSRSQRTKKLEVIRIPQVIAFKIQVNLRMCFNWFFG
jgi:hypothetical protein